ncbi:MAG: cyclic nucleotide-binding domain-containing protein [Dechloromonas sp.]|jgi:rhodanese-related sulfurtransferase|nr:cyclic nucleotide-binding domain-containing protein [Dechloromonas sp.]
MKADILARLEPLGSLSPERLKELAGLCVMERFPLGADPLLGVDLQKVSVFLIGGEIKLDLAAGGVRVLVGSCEDAVWALGRKSGPIRASRAITDIEVVRIDDDLLDIMMTWDQLSAEGNRPPKYAQDSSLWKTVTGAISLHSQPGSGLSILPAANLYELMLRFERLKVKRGEVLVREGEVGDYYFVIESGRAQVTRAIGGSQVHVAELKAGQAFGEEALVSGATRNATVTMKRDGVVLRLGKEDFDELLKEPLLHALSRSEAEARVAAGAARWLDVRYPAEFAQDGLPGARNIPLNELRAAFVLLQPDTEYIVYCQSGRRSSAAAFLLSQHGFRAGWLGGGLNAGEA